MKKIFKAITAQLDTVAALKWIDEDKGQLNFERPPVLYPAALITLSIPASRNMNRTLQSATLQVAVKLAFDFGGNTNAITPEEARDASLAYYDTVELVYKALQGFSTSEFNALERINFVPLPRPDAKKVMQMTFTSSFQDNSQV